MWKTAKHFLIALSITANLAFVAMWIAHAVATGPCAQPTDGMIDSQAIWCPLHRELDVTEEQWARIGPRLVEFQAAVGELRQRFQAIRPEVIDLVAADKPDLAAIRAKQDEILATKREIQELVASHLIAEKQILTPDQQRQLFQMLRERIGRSAGPLMLDQGPKPGMARVLGNQQDDDQAGER